MDAATMLEKAPDLVLLNTLSEEAVVSVLQKRYAEDDASVIKAGFCLKGV